MFLNQAKRIKNYKEMVSTYYAVITGPYRHFWGEYFHPAIFENENDDFKTALLKTHKRFLRDAKLSKYKRAIDLGCGIGSLSIFIAKESEADVTGINISDFQLRKAKEKQKKSKIKNVSFIKKDIMQVGEIEKKYDAAFLIDVGCHLPDKKKAIRKISKILNKGGRLIIADWLQKHKPTAFEKELLINRFNKYWCFPYMESLDNYLLMLKRLGFRIVKAKDVSKETYKNWQYFYGLAITELGKCDFQKVFSFIANSEFIKNPKRAVDIAKRQFYANLYAKICADAGVFKYGYIVAEKI